MNRSDRFFADRRIAKECYVQSYAAQLLSNSSVPAETEVIMRIEMSRSYHEVVFFRCLALRMVHLDAERLQLAQVRSCFDHFELHDIALKENLNRINLKCVSVMWQAAAPTESKTKVSTESWSSWFGFESQQVSRKAEEDEEDEEFYDAEEER